MVKVGMQVVWKMIFVNSLKWEKRVGRENNKNRKRDERKMKPRRKGEMKRKGSKLKERIPRREKGTWNRGKEKGERKELKWSQLKQLLLQILNPCRTIIMVLLIQWYSWYSHSIQDTMCNVKLTSYSFCAKTFPFFLPSFLLFFIKKIKA